MPKEVPELKKEDKDNDEREQKIEKLRQKYMDMKRGDLRKIGKKYDVYDTKKSELAEELIQARIKRGEL